MINSIYFLNGVTKTDLTQDEIKEVLQRNQGVLWVDLVQTPYTEAEQVLLELFGFHPLAVSDALDEMHVPRVDDWGDYLYLVLHDIKFDPAQEEVFQTNELDIFLGKHFLVTYQNNAIPVVEKVRRLIERDARFLQRGADHLFYKLADDLVGETLPVVDQMDDAIDTIEDQLFNGSNQQLLEQIFTLKRSLLHLRRILMPQREVFNKLARGDDHVIDKQERVFFRDIYDHMVRLYDISESLRDLISGALETYLSVINNRMNDVMKTLTIITTLFMPISFLTGFFGMNFFAADPPFTGWTSQPVLVVLLCIFVLMPVSMFVWMRSRKWM
ncbi:MAG: magnesium and cobalt transport protein CorA [Chloroflexi bacterium HGW-Chloroflexi-2]|jgi:magnesium transporter|nr:MAG: magnesium and cobalt transport protein CorA [Chloroflexi bacterium HGW-Chloroflexi-2]